MSSELARFQKHLEGLAANLIEPYLSRLSDRFARAQPRAFEKTKEINDPVWGTVILYPLEVFVLDAPLLQRLRGIRQLGVVHWVYPGATHSRFEHSLGSLQQVEQLIGNIGSQTTNVKSGTSAVPAGYRRLFRLAALVHDLGHGFMSHISEHGLKHHPAVNSLLLEFGNQHAIEARKLSEVACFFLVKSPAFIRLLDEGLRRTGEIIKIDKNLTASEVADKLAKIVLGIRIDNEYPQLQLLISGPFDADKLDYLKRDARACGVPEIVDISRLSRKIVLTAVAEDGLPKRIAKGLPKTPKIQTYKLLALKSSGVRALDEILISRLMLFSKVYRHKKVMAAETMVRLITLRLAACCEHAGSIAFLPYLFDDEAILRASPASLEAALTPVARQGAEARGSAIADVTSLAERLRNRDLFVLGCSVRKEPGSAELEESFKAARDMFLQLESISDRERFSAAICQEVNDIARIDTGKTQDFRNSLYLLVSESVVNNSDLEQTLIVSDDGEVQEYHGKGLNLKAWTDAYAVADSMGSLYCSEEIAPYAICALEKLMATEYGVEDPQHVLMDCRADPDELRSLKLRLEKKGYFDSLPRILRPLPDVMRSIEFGNRLKNLVEKFSKIDEISAQPKRKPLPGRIALWLRQFHSPDAILGAMCFLEGFEILDRAAVTGSLSRCLRQHPHLSKGCLCPFGAPKDSSQIFSYFAHDLKSDPANTFSEMTLEAALSDSSKASLPLLFVDDFLSSGGQATAIVEAWFGDSAKNNLFEVRSALAPHLAEALKKRKLEFFFAVGWKAGVEELTRCLKAHGLDGIIHIGRYADDVPSIDNIKYDSANAKAAFREVSEKMGREVLKFLHPGWEPQKLTERALGYGNRGLAICTTFNVPTHTLAVFWADSPQWSSVMQRRPKH